MIVTNSRQNNFSILRFLAAVMVLAGHMSYLSGNIVPTFLGDQVQIWGVRIFFLIGGYLVSKSWMSDPSIKHYAVKRFMRIWPPLFIFVIIAAFFVGPALSTLSWEMYYKTFFLGGCAYLKNLFFYIIYSLPGVFENNIYPNAVNGSLWTLPAEVLMYVLIPIFFWLSGYKKSKKNNTLTVVFIFALTLWICIAQIAVQTFSPTSRWVIYATDWAQVLAGMPFYFIGIFFSCFDIKKYLNLQIAIILILAYSCFIFTPIFRSITIYLIFPYLIFSFALIDSPSFSNFGKRYDLSYGMYLYGFFMQQIVMFFVSKYSLNIDLFILLIICILLTIIVSFASCVFIELPTQKLCKKLIEKF